MEQVTDSGYLEIKYDHYIFQIRIINEAEINLDVIDTKTLQVYFIENLKFIELVNATTLIAALQRKNELLKLSINHQQNIEKVIFLEVSLKISYPYIPEIEQKISLQKKNITQADMVPIQIKFINSEINEINQQLEELKSVGSKYVSMVGQGYYTNSQISITELQIPKKGKYEINLSFYSKTDYCYIYLTLTNSVNHQDILHLPEQAFYYQPTHGISSFYPHTLRTIVNIDNDNTTLNLQTLYSESYPWNMMNLILSATAV